MLEQENKPSVLLVDPFNSDRGHPVNDDRFLAECIAPLAEDFLVASSPVTSATIRDKVKARVLELAPYDARAKFTRLRLLKISVTLPSASFGHVIFQSFEELSTLLFMLLHPRTCVHVIVTSNLRPDRLSRRPLLGRFLLRTVFRLAASVIVHCQHEVDKIVQLVPGIDVNKIRIKPFHQIGWPRAIRPWSEKQPNILFLGPECNHKRLDPVLQLIQHDSHRRFYYTLCAMGSMTPWQQQQLASHPNVRVLNGHLNDDQYYELFSEASLVMLTHDYNYEGALSGAFCDAVASGTGVIVREMAPYDEFFTRFGPMGFLVDYDNPSWCKSLLNSDLWRLYSGFQQNMRRMRESCSMEANRAVFAQVLSAA